MDSPRQHRRDATTVSAANPVVRPPLVVLASLVSGAMLNVAWPLPVVPHALRLPVGCLLVATRFVAMGRVALPAGAFRGSSRSTENLE